MPDYTIDEAARQGKLDARFKDAKLDAHRVEKCGSAVRSLLSWDQIGTGTLVACDGRYCVSLEAAGWVARVYQDSECIEKFPPTSASRYARVHCEAFEAGVRFCTRVIEAVVVPDMEKTKEHEVLRVEVVEDMT